jgi:hypothetical protein
MRNLDTCFLVKRPTITLVYIYVMGSANYLADAQRFVSSYQQFPPGYDHDTLVICNLGTPNEHAEKLFAPLPKVWFLAHDNTGQDIGGYIAAASWAESKLLLCCGAPTHFHRAGWLSRLVDSRLANGPGMYGSSASFERMPHLNSTGFLVDRELLAMYPWKVITKEDRYNFEHFHTVQDHQLWCNLYRNGYRAMLVTWDSEYEWWDWRKPANGYRRGNQSDLLILWQVADMWTDAPPQVKASLARDADLVTNPRFNLRTRSFV